MTCIVGIRSKGKVWLGSDSIMVSGWDSTACHDKLFRSGPYLLACSGAPALHNVIQYDPKVLPEPKGPFFRHVVTKLIPALRDIAKNTGQMKKAGEVEQETPSTFLLAYKGYLCSVFGDFQILRPTRPWVVEGVGRSAARGALYAIYRGGRPKMVPHAQIILALEAATEFSIGVRRPFHVMHT